MPYEDDNLRRPDSAKYSRCEMTSNLTNFNNPDGHVSQYPPIVEDKCNTVDEIGNYNITSKLDVEKVTEKLIAKESLLDGNIILKPISQSAMTAIMNIKGSDIEDNNEEQKQKCLDPEVVLVDKHEKHQISTHAPLYGLVFNSQKKSENEGENTDVSAPKQYDPSIDERLPDTVTLLTTPDGGKLYLVGTAHFSVESQNDVSMIIQSVQPHIVVIELCKSRISLLQLDEQVLFETAKNLTYQFILETLKEHGVYYGLSYILLLRMAAHVAKQLGMAPGGEFRRAFEEAKKVPNCIVYLADRSVDITIRRAIRSLSWWQTMKLAWHLVRLNDSISKEDVELSKQRSSLDEMIKELGERFPVIERIFIRERDMYLTYFLQLACLPLHTANGPMPVRVVGVAGIGHTPGIIANWGKIKSSDIPPIVSVPPISLSTKILKFSIKASLLSAVAYMGYRIVLIPCGITYQSIKLSVEGLMKSCELITVNRSSEFIFFGHNGNYNVSAA